VSEVFSGRNKIIKLLLSTDASMTYLGFSTKTVQR
jgi:hypothetical protein